MMRNILIATAAYVGMANANNHVAFKPGTITQAGDGFDWTMTASGAEKYVKQTEVCKELGIDFNEATCKTAAAKLGFAFDTAGAEWHTGCLFHNNQVYFSEHVDDSTQNPSDGYICVASSIVVSDATATFQDIAIELSDTLTSVTFTGSLGTPHNFLIKDSDGNKVAGVDTKGGAFTFDWTPSADGVYTYYCAPHAGNMNGQITVTTAVACDAACIKAAADAADAKAAAAAAYTKCTPLICMAEYIKCTTDTACAAAIGGGNAPPADSDLMTCYTTAKFQTCLAGGDKKDTTDTTDTTDKKEMTEEELKEAADKKKEAADKKELAGIVDVMMGAMAALGLDDAASSILKGAAANLDLEGAQSLMALGLGIMGSGGDDVMSVFGNKEVVELLIKYKVDVKALTLALNNPFVMDGGVEKVNLEKATKALNLTADMSTLMDSVINAIPADTLKAIMTKMAASKDDYLTSYGTLDYAKFLDDATVKAAIAVYTSANPAAGIEGLLTSVSASTMRDGIAGNSLNPESDETLEDPDASGASAAAAGIVSVAAAVFMAL